MSDADTYNSMPDERTMLLDWLNSKESGGITSVCSEEDYASARAIIDLLLDEIGDDEEHPLADALDSLAHVVAAYETKRFPIRDSAAKEVLRFLMEQHGLKQEDLADCVPQGCISDILSGKRSISEEFAKKLAQRFNVSEGLFA
jgi:HTH-type transcriptional regulator/antitoxin HigA